ncbi:helix-turn-helix domain-containing protein [Paenibacillus sp. LMG 31456]|uniref:Helix-turn-helix domain-containing protein n=1 Tax=Paenibacillus foliorum TaxID=2654974 RepID=A0A972JXP3_9BACL|nr:AraC family transcriptional regulator [Paenibacillus foliorum]NOU92679.1 helix-turn-helix domain-containing protein [Paenibacillus foliorum]
MKPDFHVRSFVATKDTDWADAGFHQHRTLEISILLEGRGVFEWSGSKLNLEAGQVIIVPPVLLHRFEGKQRNRYGVMHLEQIPPRIMEHLADFESGSMPKVIALSRLDKERFEWLFREFLRILASPLKKKIRTYIAWVEVIVLFLLEHSQTDQHALTVTKAADYIRENLRQGVQIGDLATLAGLTEAGFRRLFEEIYDMSPKQYLQQCRMAEAKWLLSSSNKELNEIAEQIGFVRLHSFSLWFKKVEGMPPSEWRKMQQRKTDEFSG